MAKFFDLVEESTNTTGTGTVTLAGATSGHRTFGSVLSNGDAVYYRIRHANGTDWEIGTGTYTTSGTTLSRTLDCSSTGSLLNLSGTGHRVALVVAAKWLRGKDGYVCVRDKKAQNTPGGTFSAGTNAWRTRDLNEEQADTHNDCTLSSNQITLTAGLWVADIACPAYYCDGHQARLRNVTDSATLVLGTSMFGYTAGYNNNISLIKGCFELTASKTLEVQHQCATTSTTYGFGTAANFTDEIYTVATFKRIAA